MNYSEYIAENLEKSIIFSEYIAENLDKMISYSEYVASSLRDNTHNKLIERRNKIEK